MQKIVVASKNPVKLNATLSGFQKMFPDQEFSVEGATVPSGVREQPLTDAETFEGAMNRAGNASKEHPNADFWVGLEGGIEEKEGNMEAFAWIVIKGKNGQIGKGKTGTFFLPPRVAELLKQGMELGKADDIVFQKTNSKQDNGAVGLLTGNASTRTLYYVEAVVFALIPFKNPDLYHDV